MPRTSRWYADGFILVTVCAQRDGYQHPRISICKQYADVPADKRSVIDARLPSREQAVDSPTVHAQTLVSFEFQQNVGTKHDLSGDGEAWLQLDTEPAGAAYGGHLDTRIRVEGWGVDHADMLRKLADVDKALKAYRERCSALGAKGTQCDASRLMLALRTAWKLPVLFVVYPGYGREIYATTNPEVTHPTSAYLKRDAERAAHATEGAH